MACSSRDSLAHAMGTGAVLEGTALLCDESHDLLVRVGPFIGRIPREETALGIAEGSTRDIAILSRVGKPVSFIVEALEEQDGEACPLLSRRKAQEKALEYMMSHWLPGQVIAATVTHLEPFGAFVDIGCGVPSMIGVERLSVSRIAHPKDRLQVGQEIFAAVLSVDQEQGRVVLTHRELLGTWEENVALFRPGMTVPGYVRGVKEYGAFVELTANLSGLAECKAGIREGKRGRSRRWRAAGAKEFRNTVPTPVARARRPTDGCPPKNSRSPEAAARTTRSARFGSRCRRVRPGGCGCRYRAPCEGASGREIRYLYAVTKIVKWFRKRRYSAG